jgi:hypothetical protein
MGYQDGKYEMTLEEELERAIDERDCLETDIQLLNTELILLERAGVDEEDVEFESLEREINAMENQVMYLDSVIEDLDFRIAENMS